MKILTKFAGLKGALVPVFLFLFTCVVKAQSVSIVVHTQPSGATLSVNGQYKGKTPVTVELRTGDYLFEFTKSGYRPYSETIHVDTSKTRISVPLELIPASESTTRIIAFRSSARSGAKLSRDNTYFGAAYELGHLTSIHAYLGAYLGNLNLEGGYLKPQDAPQTDVSESPYGYVYDLTGVIPVHLGYGLILGNMARITPRAGVLINIIKGTNGNIDQRSYLIGGRLDARMVFSPLRRISISFTPGYDVPLWKDKYTRDLSSDSSSPLTKWVKGFNVNFGLEYYF